MEDELDQGIDYYGRKGGKFKLRGQRCKELGGLRKTATDCGVRSHGAAVSNPATDNETQSELGPSN